MLSVFLHFLFQCAFQLRGGFEKVINGAELRDEFCCGLFSDTRTARNVVRCVSHETEQVNDLFCPFNPIFFTNLLRSERLQSSAPVFWAAHENPRFHQLRIVFVGSHEVNFKSLFGCLQGECADDIVRLKARHFENGDAVGANDFFDDGHRSLDVFRRGFALCFVGGINFVPERAARRIKGNADIVRVLLLQQVFQRVHETKDGRRVLTF